MTVRSSKDQWQYPSVAALADLKSFYRGFYIADPSGNNAFSFFERENKRIFVAPLIESGIDGLAVGREIAFSEIDDEVEVNYRGLKNFLYWADTEHKQDIFIFDNHNHAFFFWMWAVKHGRLTAGGKLVHVDQHRDLRDPVKTLAPAAYLNLETAYTYANYELNVGNFIKPAVAAGIFSGVDQVVGREDFEKPLPETFTLDIDMDVFSDGMNYIPIDHKLNRLREWRARTRLVTIATSPFFMDQGKAIELIHRLLA